MSAKERYRFIRSEMVRRGVTNAAVSREASCSREYLFRVMKGQDKGYRVRIVLAKLCKVPVEYFFPDTPDEYRRAA